MSKYLVTGADGFIGSHLVEHLLLCGHEVRAFCFYNSFSTCGWLDSLHHSVLDEIELVHGDIRDFSCVRSAVLGCDSVFHLASLIAIPYSYKAPQSYIDTNVSGTLNILQSCLELGIRRLVHTSTSETYGTAQFVPITEKHPLVAQSPYAASKIAADQLALSFFHSFDLPVSILRPFNTYGPRQSARAVIPAIITQILSGSRQIRLGALSPTRDFNFVTDTCAAFKALSDCNEALGKVVNAASKFEISIGDTAQLIAQVMNADLDIVTDEQRLRPTASEVNRLYGDNTLLTQLTRWQPSYGGLEGFRNGLALTAEWFADPSNLMRYKSGSYAV